LQNQCGIIVKKMRSILYLLLLSLTLSNAQQLNLRKSSGNFMWEIFYMTTLNKSQYFIISSLYCIIIYVIYDLSN
jgi:hypothetical protein